MIWLTPWFLVAGLSIAGPIVFHLWRRAPRGRRFFSSTMFLTASPPRITHRSRIEHWLLLCLRALALLLLALAFARPVWLTNAKPPSVVEPGKTVAILVDVSASLRRDGVWESLREQLEQRLDDLPANAQLGLFTFDQDWHTLVPLEVSASATNQQLVRERLTALAPGWGATKLGDGLTLTMQAVREFQEDRQPGDTVEIWLATDLASGSDLTGLAEIDWPETARLELITPRIELGTNAGLQWVGADSQKTANAELRVRVSNSQTSTRDQFQIGWEGADAEALIDIHVPAGQSRTVAIPARPAELPEATPLRLSGDDHEFDNRLWLTARQLRQIQILYLGDELADDIASPRYFLEQALAGLPDAEITIHSAAEMTAEPTAGETPTLTIWTDAEIEPPAWLPAMISRGGALLAVPRDSAATQAMSAFLNLPLINISEAEVKNYSLLGEIDWEDPLFATFAQSRFADFSGIHFWKHRRVGLPDSFAGRILARFDDGEPYMIAQSAGAGQIWLMTAGWHPADSQLSRSSKFAPLLDQFLNLAAPNSGRLSRGVVGDVLPLPQTADATKWVIQRPDGREVTVTDGGVAELETDMPGVYVAVSETETVPWAVNVPAAESKTDPLPAEALERQGALMTSAADRVRQSLSPTARRQLQWEDQERRQSLWRWCLVGAGILILMETILAARRSSVSPQNPVSETA